jgi:hypothetical protein
MHFRYDWPDQRYSRQTLVNFYATQAPENQRASQAWTAALLALLVLTVPWLESALL